MNELAGKIQDSELEVMRALWEAKEALPLIEIRRVLSGRCGWEDSTIKTLIRRLQLKGIVRLERRGIYSAVVTEESSPPDRYAPTGTSARRRMRVASINRLSSSSR